MKTRWISIPATVIVLYSSGQAIAASLPDYAVKAGCGACHAIDKKIVGPAWEWVAYEYKDKKAEGKKNIIGQITNGGKGRWTKYTHGVPMPPYGTRTDAATREKLADFILNLKPVAPPAK